MLLGLRFQHTAARRRLLDALTKTAPNLDVSTHSRPKAAAKADVDAPLHPIVSTHSRPKAAAYT